MRAVMLAQARGGGQVGWPGGLNPTSRAEKRSRSLCDSRLRRHNSLSTIGTAAPRGAHAAAGGGHRARLAQRRVAHQPRAEAGRAGWKWPLLCCPASSSAYQRLGVASGARLRPPHGARTLSTSNQQAGRAAALRREPSQPPAPQHGLDALVARRGAAAGGEAGRKGGGGPGDLEQPVRHARLGRKRDEQVVRLLTAPSWPPSWGIIGTCSVYWNDDSGLQARGPISLCGPFTPSGPCLFVRTPCAARGARLAARARTRATSARAA